MLRWMVCAAVNEACLLTLLADDASRPRMLGVDEHRFHSVRYFKDTDTTAWHCYEPWMTTIVDLDTGQVGGGCVDGHDHTGVNANRK